MAGKLKYLVALALPAAVLVLAATQLPLLTSSTSGAPLYETVAVGYGPIRKFVSTSGPVRALVTVSVGSQLSGQISELKADFNTEVKAGDELAILDDKTFVARVAQVKADLVAAKATLANHEAAPAQGRGDRAQRQAAAGACADAGRQGHCRDHHARQRHARCRGGARRGGDRQGAGGELQGHDRAARSPAGAGRDRPAAHAHPLAHRRHGDRAHRRRRANRGRELPGAGAVQDRAGPAPHPHRGAGERGGRGQRHRRQSRRVQGRCLPAAALLGPGLRRSGSAASS